MTAQSIIFDAPESKDKLRQFLRDQSPVLVEVRFEGSGTSPDWHLVNDYDELGHLFDTVKGKATITITSIWRIEGDIEMKVPAR